MNEFNRALWIIIVLLILVGISFKEGSGEFWIAMGSAFLLSLTLLFWGNLPDGLLKKLAAILSVIIAFPTLLLGPVTIFCFFMFWISGGYFDWLFFKASIVFAALAIVMSLLFNYAYS